MECDDEGEVVTEDMSVMVDTCEIEPEQTRRAELVDSLMALGLWKAYAQKAVEAGTVATEQHIVACKRFCAASTANNPCGSLWSNWLSDGRVPPIPQLTDTDPGVIEAARRLSAELDQHRDQGGPMIDQRALAALKARQAGGVLKTMPPKRPFEWVQP
jgi:hypothetical protein